VLRHREFRLLWTGQVLSLVGTRMQGAALSWHLYDLTRDAAITGSLGIARLIPLMTFAMVGGMLADMLDRRRLMLGAQTIMGLIAASLGIATLLGSRAIWPLFAVAALNAIVVAFDGPARQSLLPRLVPADEFPRAISLNSMTNQVASILGPALMGVLITHASVGLVYCFNAVSFVFVIGGLLLMKPVPPSPGTIPPRLGVRSLREGLSFLRRSELLLTLMLLDFLATFFASATPLLPVYAKEILHVDARGYGWLVSAESVGSFVAAAAVSVLPGIRKQGQVVLGAVFVYGLATVAFGLGREFWVCFLALAATGAADTVSTVVRQTVRQLHTPDHLRGRTTGISMLFFQGGPQLGSLEAGLVARWLGPVVSVVSGGIGCMLTVLLVGRAAPWLWRYEGGKPSPVGEESGK
jgi:MFS family permease